MYIKNCEGKYYNLVMVKMKKKNIMKKMFSIFQLKILV
jgi:hypothetical protein